MIESGLWNAVASRDESADGCFVYAVRSTGIFCRPSCPSRRPRRERVEFFPTPAMAAERGYRACRRCRPDQGRTAGPDPAPATRVRRICEAVARRPDARWTSAALARTGGTSVPQMQRAFRATLGLAPRDFVAACRRRRFLVALRNGARVTDAVYEAGYGSPSRVYGTMPMPGMTPATYGRGGLGAAIRWTTVASPVGRILVASTVRGLCFVEVGRSDGELVAALRREFPRAQVAARASADLRPLAKAAKAAASAEPVPHALPVDIRGTAFQWRVWQALTRIPKGETRSYGEVARAVGRPAATRAVASACAANPLAVVVPCHRVVRADGTAGGYRWGVGVKQALLDRERD
jgi:AraC family transcriptional regulator of adaptative response/methylated-DNA-[protein]-cysteine methyltransferase